MPAGAPITRRSFLRRTLAGAALLALGGTVLRHTTGYRLPPRARPLRNLSDKEALVLSAVLGRVLAPDQPPEGGPAAPSHVEVDALGAIDDYLAELPPPALDDLRALLHLVEHSPFLFSLRFARFTRLPPDAQDAVLAGWEQSRLEVRRLGFAALKRLSMLGYYGDPRTHALLGYAPMPLPQQQRPAR